MFKEKIAFYIQRLSVETAVLQWNQCAQPINKLLHVYLAQIELTSATEQWKTEDGKNKQFLPKKKIFFFNENKSVKKYNFFAKAEINKERMMQKKKKTWEIIYK